METKFRFVKFKENLRSRDPVINLIGKKLYSELDVAERENKALEIYNKTRLSKMGIGKKYERYLQYYYDKKKLSYSTVVGRKLK